MLFKEPGLTAVRSLRRNRPSFSRCPEPQEATGLGGRAHPPRFLSRDRTRCPDLRGEGHRVSASQQVRGDDSGGLSISAIPSRMTVSFPLVVCLSQSVSRTFLVFARCLLQLLESRSCHRTEKTKKRREGYFIFPWVFFFFFFFFFCRGDGDGNNLSQTPPCRSRLTTPSRPTCPWKDHQQEDLGHQDGYRWVRLISRV